MIRSTLLSLLLSTLLTVEASAAQVFDESKLSTSSAGAFLSLDDGDAFGSAIESLGDLDGDGLPELAIGARFDDDGGPDRGAVWIVHLDASHNVTSASKISSTAGGFTGILDDQDQFGSALASLGDLDGDGTLELAVGAPRDDDGGANRGALWILSLDALGGVVASTKISSTSGWPTATLQNGDKFASAVSAYADVDGNGVVDLLVGSPDDDSAGAQAGTVYLLELDASFQVLQHTNFTDFLLSPLPGERVGTSLDVLGDLNGDGFEDFVLGAPCADDQGSDEGGLYVAFGRATPSSTTFKKNLASGTVYLTLADGDHLGASVASLGDAGTIGVDGIWIAAGAEGDDAAGVDRGALWILKLSTGGAITDGFPVRSGASGFEGTLADDDEFGSSLGTLVDLEGGAYSALLVGAQSDDDGGLDRGAAYVLETCVDRARLFYRNDAGNTNPSRYTTSLAILGEDWISSVNLAGSGHTFALIVGYTAATELSLPFGVLLVDITDPFGELIGFAPQTGLGQVSFSVIVPKSPALCGLTVYTQALGFFGAPLQLFNGFDLEVGY